MKKIGILNSEIAKIISRQGHGDLLLITDAGFAIPKDIEVVDIALTKNQPMVIDLLKVLNNFFWVEKIYMADETARINPSHFKNVSQVFGENVPAETMPHQALKDKSKHVKAAIRTGDFTAYANVILQSGAGNEWFTEK